MNVSEETLLNLLEDNHLLTGPPHFYTLKEGDDGHLAPSQMAHLYISVALLITIMDFLSDQLWLKNKADKRCGNNTSYEDFITPFFKNELTPILFLKDFLIRRGAEDMKRILEDTIAIEAKILSLIMTRTGDDHKTFVVQSLKEMTKHFVQEENEQAGRPMELGHKGLLLYRTFDKLDEVFKLNYQLDKDMTVDHCTKERLYQRAGVGVQSGYSTILLALHRIKAKSGNSLVDLGSGYGRVGLVCSLLRPDIDITGYEYVPHRVTVSNNASKSFGLTDSLQFLVQDLSLQSFQIPDADIYYLYDPFTIETYRYVLKQIVEVSKRQKITVVTKGNASSWLMDISKKNAWPKPEIIDHGNLCLFRSNEITLR